MSKTRRYWQYRVTDRWGVMETEDRIQVGALTLDYWHGKRHDYSIYDFKQHEVVGGYSVVNEGEATPEQYADLRKSGRAVPGEKVAA